MTKFFAGVAVFAACGSAMAGTVFGVEGISNNAIFSTQAGESQLSVDVSSGSGTVIFTVSNASGGATSSIANVYFDDLAVALLGSVTITNGAGVAFSSGGSPSDLPSGNLVGFQSERDFAANNPKPTNGINPGESLILTFNLINGATYASVLSAMNNGSLRVGMHVIAFANGESESFITPTPGSMALLGLAGLCVGRRRR